MDRSATNWRARSCARMPPRHWMRRSTINRAWIISTSTGGGACSLPPVSHCLNAGGMGRIDYESETFIPMTGGGFDVSHALRGEGFDASEDGTGRGTPIVPVAIQERAVSENPDNGPQGAGFKQDGSAYTLEARNKVQAVAFVQNTRDEVRLMGGDGSIAGALAAEPGAKQQCYVAFDCKGTEVQTVSDGSHPTLRSMGHANSYQNAGGHAAVAFDLRGREGGAMPEGPHDTANIRAASGGSSRSYVAQPWAVRRLTTRECERLQGFHDDYTLLSGVAKPQADGPRYKQLGNSWAVNCIDWIAERLCEIHNWEIEA